MGRSILIASGKGGVGKSTLAASLSQALARQGHKVCLLDMDIGLRGQDTFLGVESQIVYDSLDVLTGLCRLHDALIPIPGEENLSLLPCPQFSRAKDITPAQFRSLVDQVRALFAYVIIDAPACIERGLRGILKASVDDCLLLCTPDDLCLRDAERVASLLQEKGLPRPRLIVNRLNDALIESGEMYNAKTCSETLDLPLLGEIPDDINVYRAQLKHLWLYDIDCPARYAIERIARRITGEAVPLPCIGKRRPWYIRMWDFMLEPRVKEVKHI